MTLLLYIYRRFSNSISSFRRSTVPPFRSNSVKFEFPNLFSLETRLKNTQVQSKLTENKQQIQTAVITTMSDREDEIEYPPDPPSPTRKRALRSLVWEHFEKLTRDESQCNHCLEKLPSTSGTTTPLWRHLANCSKYEKPGMFSIKFCKQ